LQHAGDHVHDAVRGGHVGLGHHDAPSQHCLQAVYGPAPLRMSAVPAAVCVSVAGVGSVAQADNANCVRSGPEQRMGAE